MRDTATNQINSIPTGLMPEAELSDFRGTIMESLIELFKNEQQIWTQELQRSS